MNNLRTAIILVAGTGSRLKPLTNDIPKALVSLGRETILQRLVRQLAGCGISHLVLATGYCEDMIRLAMSTAHMTVDYCWNKDYELTQNSISLGICADAVAGEAFIKLDGDLVLDAQILDAVIGDSGEMTVAVDTMRQLDQEAMKVRLGADRSIIEFGKSLPLNVSDAESIGIEKMDVNVAKTVFHRIRELKRAGVSNRYYEDIYAELISESQLSARAVDVAGFDWTEVDTFEDLDRARMLVCRSNS